MENMLSKNRFKLGSVVFFFIIKNKAHRWFLFFAEFEFEHIPRVHLLFYIEGRIVSTYKFHLIACCSREFIIVILFLRVQSFYIWCFSFLWDDLVFSPGFAIWYTCRGFGIFQLGNFWRHTLGMPIQNTVFRPPFP